MYGLAENHNSTVSAVVREFIENALDIDIEEQELYIEFACRLGTPDGINVNNIANNRNDRMGRRPVLCTFSHYTEADYIMRKTRLLKGTRYAIDRDYPTEIALARKKMWPEVKELRKVPNSNVQLKFPAKIVVNGRVVKDAFPQWDHLMKVPVTAGLNYICVEESIEQQRNSYPHHRHLQRRWHQLIYTPVIKGPHSHNKGLSLKTVYRTTKHSNLKNKYKGQICTEWTISQIMAGL